MGLYLPKLLISVARSEVASVVCCRCCQVQSACAAGYLRHINADLRRVRRAARATPTRLSLFAPRAKLEFMLIYRPGLFASGQRSFVRILSISRSFRPRWHQRSRKCLLHQLLLFR